jgi:hypothetical protein
MPPHCSERALRTPDRARRPPAHRVRAVLAVTLIAVIAGLAPVASAGGAAPAPHWRTLTIRRAWLETVIGARRVRERAHADTDTVQHESACVRHSRYVVDCPFRYVIGSELAENFERCNDIGRVTEVGEGRYSFAARKPGCALINNETP